MGQSLSLVIVHVVFSTKARFPFLGPPVRERMQGYLAKLCRSVGGECYRVGGTADHVHIATTLPRVMSVGDLVEEVKKRSSRWVRRGGRGMLRKFHWQGGYAAFSVSASRLEGLERYIERQEEHHRKEGFQEELRRLLTRHGVEFDERYVWE